MQHKMAVDETYEIVVALRMEVLVSEVNRRRAQAEQFTLIGSPYVSGAFLCQAYTVAPFDKPETVTKRTK